MLNKTVSPNLICQTQQTFMVSKLSGQTKSKSACSMMEPYFLNTCFPSFNIRSIYLPSGSALIT